jgi:hypothetical protein
MSEIDHAAIMNRCAEKEQKLGLDKLNAFERVVFLVSTCNFEMELNSISGYYYNSISDHTLEIVEALKQVGAFTAAAAIHGANQLFPQDIIYDRTKRYEVWKSIDEALFDQYENQFFSEKPEVFDKLCAYIEVNYQDFQDNK